MSQISKNICFQYFSGNASPLQRNLILEWLAADSANQEQYYHWVAEWEMNHVQFIPDSTAAASRILTQIDENYTPVEPEYEIAPAKRNFWVRSKKWWVAASIIFLIATTLYIFQNSIRYIKYQTAYGEIKEFNLPDGTSVILNANSSLLLPRWGFEKGNREVVLNGEAAFFVVHTKANQKFFVHTKGQLNVEVLGTEFSVYSRNSTNKAELKKGSVKLLLSKQKDQRPVLMKPGDMVSIGKEGKLVLKHQDSPENFIAWKDHRFVFDNTSLQETMNAVEEFFGTKITISNTLLEQKKITGSFKAESGLELLTALSEMFSLEIVKEGDDIILK